MFWQLKQVSSPHLEALLNREDCTIYDLMDDEDIIQECKSQNKKLLEFLTRPNVMDELITLMIQNPTTEVAESHRYKYPHIACEILSCDIPMLNEKLAGDIGLLQKLYSFIDTDKELNPLLASFFSKAMGILVIRSKDQNWYSYQFTCLQVFAFLKSKEKCVDLLLQHLETSAIMNLVLKLVTEVEGSETRQNVLDWLNSQQLVQRLVKLLSPECQPSRHSNAAQLLSDMIEGVRDISKPSSELSVESDPILCTLESEETTTLLLDTILVDKKLESSIVGGIQVLLTLLKPKTNGNSNDQNRSLDEAADKETIMKISNAVIPYFGKFHDLLLNPPYMPPVKTTVGLLEVPVGNTRLHVLKMFATLLSINNPLVREKMVELDIFKTFLDLFFQYPWNNFLHTQVRNALREALESSFPESDKDFYEYLFIKCEFLEKILDAFTASGKTINLHEHRGHVIEIMKNIASLCEKNNVFNTFITTNLPQETVQRWQSTVNVKLVLIKIQQNTLSEPQYMVDNDSNNSDYNYSQDTYGQSVPHYIEMYEYRNEVHKDDEEPMLYNNSSDQPGSVVLNAEDQAKGEEMFNKLCECRDKSNVSDWWLMDKQLKYERSSSSEDEDEEEDRSYSWATFPNVNSLQPSPWDINAPAQSDSDNWANFASHWPGENETTTSSNEAEEKVEDVDWACFANFDSTLTFATDNNEVRSLDVEAPQPDKAQQDEVKEVQYVEEESIQEQNNSNEDAIKEKQVSEPEKDVVQASDDDNANSIVMIETKISEVTEDKSSDENVQNTVETIISSDDSSSLANAIKNNAETINKST